VATSQPPLNKYNTGVVLTVLQQEPGGAGDSNMLDARLTKSKQATYRQWNQFELRAT